MKSSAIAIVGMAGRFPGARSVAELWRNLRDGVESIRDLSEGELLGNGVTPEELANPDYVKRAAILDDVALFDAGFFGLSPRDASIMDPQHRHFLECAWEAIEDAGHPPQAFQQAGGSIAVFAGSGLNSYLIHNLLANRGLVASAGLFQLKQTGNDKDVLATRVSYQFDLRGPSISVQTACSTSLVAVHLACQSLLNFECDMALAGGVTIEVPHGQGYIHREGEILSRDGRCRSFDASSSGTVFSSGLGIVALRRLEDALADRDQIHAVILGSAVNNDGARKVGYLAPSVEGQAEVIAEALEFAGVGADDIGYVEAHGTGTVVGDPIEVRALTQAFRRSTARAGFCGLGSLKSNLGHLDAAAGVTGLIKTALALRHAQIPPTLHFERINPRIEIAGSPFYVNDKLRDWPADGKPRRAGVTALGIGGTNAHVVLEAAQPLALTRTPKPYQLLTVSAKTESAADRAFARLAGHIAGDPERNLADAAFTCQLGRHGFPHRRAVVVEDSPEARAALPGLDPRRVARGVAPRTAPGVVFLFSGQGSQYVDMGREMYEHEPVFRDALDACARILREPLGLDLLEAIYPSENKEKAAERLSQTWLTQPALFAVEYALAQWWRSHGVQPTAMIGHSLGEYVAACLAGVFSLEDALALVAMRGRLIADLPAGAMLSVPLAAHDLQLTGSLSIAAINNPGMCVVSGPTPEIAAFEESLAKQSIACRRLFTSHAFHSAMMDPILGVFEERLRGVKMSAPRIPYLSNVTGTWITAEEATDPAYWARHIRSTVRFSDNLAAILSSPEQVLVECGPGNVLTSLACMQGGAAARVFATLPHPRENTPALRFALQTLGQLWSAGVEIDFARLHAPGSVQRVSLPTYPFEHQRFWIDPDRVQPPASPVPPAVESDAAAESVALYRRVWKPAPLPETSPASSGPWLIFRDALGLADALSTVLRKRGEQVVTVEAGSSYQPLKSGSATVRPSHREDYDALVADLAQAGCTPSRIIHLWPVVAQGGEASLDETLGRCFLSPLFLAQALAANDVSAVEIAIVSNALQQVKDEPVRAPERAVLFGLARTLHKELPGFACQAVDLDFDGSGAARYAQSLIAELSATHDNATVAYRRFERFAESLEDYDLSAAAGHPRLQTEGVYLITGGLGALGLAVAEHLARAFKARLALVGRTSLPPESEWEIALRAPGLSEPDRQRLRKLIQIRSLAGGLAVAHADVTDLAQMRAAVRLAQERFGCLDGVLHAAGVLDDAPLLLKSAESAARVLAPKVQGTLVLEQALQGVLLRCFVLFSSISSIDPPAGQVDYAAANAFLDAFALSRKDTVQVINWGAWRQVGMAARTLSPHPWLEERLLDAPDRVVFASHVSSRDHWALAEHRVKNGPAMMPGTAQLELVAGAFARGSFRGAVEFRDVFFVAPLVVRDGETREVRVQLQRDEEKGAGSNAFRFSVLSRGSEWTEHSVGTVALCRTRPASRVDLADLAARCRLRELVFSGDDQTRQEVRLTFGPRWHSLRKLDLGQGEALAEVELDPQFAGDVAALHQHPALLDMATGACLYLTHDYDRCDDLFLPISYRSLRVYRRFPAHFFSHIRARETRGQRSEVESFDITVFDEQGALLAEIEAFAMRRIVAPEKTLQDRAAHALSEPPIDIPARSGIAPQEGVRVLTRILQAETPVAVVALPAPLPAPALTPIPAPAASQPAATLAPAALGGTEATLALWWQELLGVDRVGLDDDFFDLGGHSLTGVRLIAKIKKTFQTNLELATLFEARTVRQLAAVIGKSRLPAASTSGEETRAWKALVSIQPNGSRIPLFCVHAVGGDVLFYQQLARALGPDQPFYAFQSPLVAQPDRSDITIEEMAELYIREMRAFYPSGPYLLGGASYGGFVLYEMARQLQQQGIMPAAVLMFDVRVPGSGQHFGNTVKLQKFWDNIRQERHRYLSRKIREKSRYFYDNFREVFIYPVVGAAYCKLGRPLPPALRFHWISRMHWRVLDKYSFKPFPGKITQVRATDRGPEVLGRIDDVTLGWKDLARGGVEIIEVPTQHMVMLFEPYVATFAEILKPLLAERETADVK